MNLTIDTHSHTLASGHAYSTVHEMILGAKENGLSLLSITEHGIAMPGTCHEMYFHNLKVIPREQYGIKLLLGVEANIMDFEGTLDTYGYYVDELELVIASLHMPCIKPGTLEENTNAYIGAMQNPHVNIIGHPDDSKYPIDYERLVKAAKKYHVLLELNNSSLSPNSFRLNSRENAIQLLTLCKQYEVMITVGSDAHVANDAGNFCFVKELLEFTQFPESLVINTDIERFQMWLEEHKALRK